MSQSAIVLCDSVAPGGSRLTSLQLRYPKFIHGEFLTHRVFSRNSSSSRAVPVERLIQDVLDGPVVPAYWGRNQPGMAADEEHDEMVWCWSPINGWDSIPDSFWNEPGGESLRLDPSLWHLVKVNRLETWLNARNQAVDMARAFAKAGYHKQLVNRLLEPWSHINTVVTSTEWGNFFELRCHPAAQPEMRLLAEAIRGALAASTPTPLLPGQWHTPYIYEDERLDWPAKTLVRVSTARCARNSYKTHDERATTIDEDVALYHRLVGSTPLHASPAEHQATPSHLDSPLNPLCGNFDPAWNQHRKCLEQGIEL